MSHLHIIADSRGVARGDGPSCAVCGETPFPAGKPSPEVFGPNFTDHQYLADPRAPDVCAGCVSLLSGRPGDDPPPLRTMYAVAVEGEPCAYPSGRELADILRYPPVRPFVLVVGESRQKHACLRAGTSSADRILVGLDDGQAEVWPEHISALDAAEALRSWHTGDEIESGQYSPIKISKQGPAAWAELDAVIAPHRSTRLLHLLCLVARKPEAQPTTEADMIYDEIDEAAACVLRFLAAASDLRSQDGIRFWRDIYPRRVRGVAHLPLREQVADLARRLECSPISPFMVSLHELLDRHEDPEAIATAIRRRGTLLVSLAYTRLQEARHVQVQPFDPS